MTNKIAIVLVAILVTAITVPTAYAALTPTDEKWSQVCDNKKTDGKLNFADFSCAVNIYQMFHDINGLLVQVDTMNDTLNDIEHKTKILNLRANGLQHSDTKFQNTITKIKDNIKSSNADINNKIKSSNTEIDDLKYRLQIIEGKIPAPTVSLTMHVSPKIIHEGESFEIFGNADRLKQNWVDIEFFNPNGTAVQLEWDYIKLGNVYSPVPIEPNHNWTGNGNYTIQARHGNETVNATINYTMAETP